ncbi:MAG: DUF2029 domain-containing protein, partial [Gemmatimonadetes bacterium]|nr:DUF2029 domain-containing protein [Gemmatimonadota bacterium]
PDPPLSDDLYRYLWDGRVGNAGIHPFVHAPDSDELGNLRDEAVWPHINHPDVPTIYPPVAQYFFRVLDVAAPTPRGVRVVMSLVDLLGVAALAGLLRKRGRPAALCVVAAWCPLSVMETAGGAHIDALGSLLLVGAMVLWVAPPRPFLAGLVLGLSTLVKPTALALAPALLMRAPGRRVTMVAGALVAGLVALPFLSAGAQLFTGFLTYAEHWRFNDSLYSALVAGGLTPRGARGVLSAAVLILAIVLPWRLRRSLASVAAVLGAGIVLSPTVHPWYALWLVPWLPFLPERVRPAGVVLVALLPLSYAAAWLERTTGVWVEPAWLRPAVWGPVFLLLAAGGAAGLLARQRSGAPQRGAEDG